MPFSAKRARFDEFYTHYESIEEIYKSGYVNADTLKDKIIYCCCDDYRWSNYVKFWKNNFEYFNIKKLIATNYDIGDGAYIYTYDGHNETIEQGQVDGSFENYNDFVTEDTIIITNPPFSKSRYFFGWLQQNNAKFYIHNTWLNTIKCYNNLNDIYAARLCIKYDVPAWDKYGITVNASGLVTNIELKDTNNKKCKLEKTFDEVKHDFYEADYFYKGDAWKGKILNVDRCEDIPNDYDDFIGVPISFIAVQPWIRKQYKIYGLASYGKKFYRLRIKKIK